MTWPGKNAMQNVRLAAVAIPWQGQPKDQVEDLALRYAIYYTPAHHSALERFGARWLGVDAFTREALAQPQLQGLQASDFTALTDDPRRYGFHATLKAPFHLAEGISEADLLTHFRQFATRTPAFETKNFKVASIRGFLAIVTDPADPQINALCDEVVKDFEQLRRALSPDDITRRRRSPLTPRQDKLMLAWGYPYVFEEFLFHMTLSNRITDPAIEEQMLAAAQQMALPLLDAPCSIDTIGLFIEREPGAPFQVLEAATLAG